MYWKKSWDPFPKVHVPMNRKILIQRSAGEEETTVLGDLKKKDIDSVCSNFAKDESFEKEEDGDNLGFSEEKDYESDDFDPPIEIQGEFLPPSRAVEDFMEEIEDSPFQRDGMGLLVDYISSAHAAAEIQESAGALEPAPILEQGTINKLGLSPRESEFLANVITKDLNANEENASPRTLTTMSRAITNVQDGEKLESSLPSKLLDNTSDQKTALTEAKMEDDYLKEKASKIGEFENAEMVSVHPTATACMDRLFR